MARQLFVRMASAAGIFTLAALLLALDPFLGPTVGANLSKTPPVTVDRTLKGDRLPMANVFALRAPRAENAASPQVSASPSAQIPVGCDPAFSPISSPRLASVYRRCMT
jgi:hypothetical protein